MAEDRDGQSNIIIDNNNEVFSVIVGRSKICWYYGWY